MYIKLNYDTWGKYINEYFSFDNKISIKEFCKERNINPSQFFYHRKRIEMRDKPVVLQAIDFKNKSTNNKEKKISTEAKINIDSVNTVYLTCGIMDLRKIQLLERKIILRK